MNENRNDALNRFSSWSLMSHACLLALACPKVVGTTAAATLTNTPPNIVVFLADDQGWGDLSLNGNSNLSTPNIDKLARDGAMFDRFFVCPVCSPTRAEFLTGRYHPRSGVYSTSAGGERMDLDETTIAQLFQNAGYATAAFGKWHNGMQHPYHPNARGFDEFYGFCSGHWGDYFSPLLEHNGRLVRGEGFIVDDLTNHAMQFIEQHKDQPFFCYLPHNTPHSPMQVPDRWWDAFRDNPLAMHHREPEREDLQHTRAALAMCENIDWNVGRLLQKLDDLQIADNTIVVYFSDNGPNGVRWNGDMKGRKGSTDEGGVRSPLIVRWPNKIARGRRVAQIAAAIDMLPTLTELAGVAVSSGNRNEDDTVVDGNLAGKQLADAGLDGISLASLLLNPNNEPPVDRLIFSHWQGRVSVRNQRFRYDDQGQLFDMDADPGQRVDVAAQYPQVAQSMRVAVNDWRRDVLSLLTETQEDRRDHRPFLVGHPKFSHTQLPARDGRPYGGIERSNRYPNCSFFQKWTSVDDSITWDVEVGATGDYEIEIYYACPATEIGSTIELTLGESRLVGKVTEAWDGPLRGQENDRVERTESYIKDFAPMTLGRLPLTKGQNGTLTLRALDVPGSQVMEFRLMMFHRQDR